MFIMGSFYIVQVGLKSVTLLPQPLECWDYRCEPPHLANNHLSRTKRRDHEVCEMVCAVVSPCVVSSIKGKNLGARRVRVPPSNLKEASQVPGLCCGDLL